MFVAATAVCVGIRVFEDAGNTRLTFYKNGVAHGTIALAANAQAAADATDAMHLAAGTLGNAPIDARLSVPWFTRSDIGEAGIAQIASAAGF